MSKPVKEMIVRELTHWSVLLAFLGILLLLERREIMSDEGLLQPDRTAPLGDRRLELDPRSVVRIQPLAFDQRPGRRQPAEGG